MTGKELILYILQNNLEDVNIDEFITGYFIGFMTLEEAAAKFEVGTQTVKLWHKYGLIKGIEVKDMILVCRDSEDPRQVLRQLVSDKTGS